MNYNASYTEATANLPTGQQSKIVDYIRQQGSINDTEIQKLLGVKKHGHILSLKKCSIQK